MKSTGVVRRIDELGRVVIPRNVRKEIHCKEAEPFEIFVTKNGDIVLKKYRPMCDDEEND